MSFEELRSDHQHGETSAQIRERVTRARALQHRRFAGEPFFTNARMTARHVRKCCRLGGDGEALLRQAMTALGLSARAYSKVLKVARTIADLEESASSYLHWIFPLRTPETRSEHPLSGHSTLSGGRKLGPIWEMRGIGFAHWAVKTLRDA